MTPRQFESFKRLKEICKEFIFVSDLSLEKLLKDLEIESEKNDRKIFIILGYQAVMYSMRSIVNLIEKHYSDDCLSIARSIFEHYLRSKALRVASLDAEKLACASLASMGILKYKTKQNGKIDYNKVENVDGRTISIDGLSYRALSAMTGDPADEYLYNQLYRNLSFFVHKDVASSFVSSLLEKNLLYKTDDDMLSGVYTISLILFIYFEEIIKNDWVTEDARRDIFYKLGEISDHLTIMSKNKHIRSGMVPVLFA